MHPRDKPIFGSGKPIHDRVISILYKRALNAKTLRDSNVRLGHHALAEFYGIQANALSEALIEIAIEVKELEINPKDVP